MDNKVCWRRVPSRNPTIPAPSPVRKTGLRANGFALVVTISLMALLTVIGIGLLSLSSIALRGASQSSALAEARANARLGLLIAIGELQRELGPDQRVSATGSILEGGDPNHPHWTGVWDSWKAGKDTSGSDVASEHSTIYRVSDRGLSPSYQEDRKDHFRRWLVSLKPGEQEGLDSPKSVSLTATKNPGANDDAVLLVAEGSLGKTADTKDRVTARLLDVESTAGSGRFGWWVGDESVKARVIADSFELDSTLSLADRISRVQAAGSTGTSTLEGLDAFEKEEQLVGLPSRKNIRLVEGATDDVAGTFHHATPFSLQVLADVREGGLKRDLSALLERPINERETRDEHMLYRFDTRGQERVPIQDLAAYYQLYRTQLMTRSRQIRSGFQVSNPDFGGGGTAFTREYTNLYRLPVPVKLQFLMSLTSTPRTAADKKKNPKNKDTDKLNIGITPAMTLWNPNNVPMAMNYGNAVRYATQMRFFNMPIAIKWTKEGKGYTSKKATSVAWITSGLNSGGDRDTGFTLFFSGNRPIVFEPGEVKVFSIGNTSLNQLTNSNVFKADREVIPGWNPDKFLKMRRSDQSNGTTHVDPPDNTAKEGALTFSAGDKISFTIEPTEVTDLANGSALQFFMRQSSVSQAKRWMDRHYQLVSRLKGNQTEFNRELMRRSFPGKTTKINFEAVSGSEIKRANVPFLLVNLVAGCEVSEAASSTPFAGRQFASRPFLHSSPITGCVFIDGHENSSLYHHGWNWWVEDINSVFEANIGVTPGNANGYYGGGYTPEFGTTHVVQQEIPLIPPISIAALSHAHLTGYSLANANLGPRANNTTVAFQDVTASGQGGLFPHTLQAIGNSYAHPYIAANRAFTKISRNYSELTPDSSVTLADHSYLANKALWDEYFFSSIAPYTTSVFEGQDTGDAVTIARNFFENGGDLLNRRMVPYSRGLDSADLSRLYRNSRNGTPATDEIASYLMLEGPFNVNSTSVEAWEAFLSSLKGKSISFLEADASLRGGLKLSEQEAEGTPVASFSVPNGEPYSGSPNDPDQRNQWLGWRVLDDDEIRELAEAMVEQVKLRGPFLSLSEFVNRRLDRSNLDLAVKGALQAALDDGDVSINAGFRTADRSMSGGEVSSSGAAFRQAMEGPVAYGSAAYVDQADILRNFASQLTPRGDTFLIRSYGDSLDAGGRVKARAWCEAVVQRVPDYLETTDEPFLKQSELTSDINRRFGRQFRIVTFRYLHEGEV